MLRNKSFIYKIFFISSILYTIIIAAILQSKEGWLQLDYRANDIFYNIIVKLGYGPIKSDRIVYLTIDDKTYGEVFERNQFDRLKFAKVLESLASLNPEAVGLDIIFAYPSDTLSDVALVNSLSNLPNIIVPVSFALTLKEKAIKNGNREYKSINKFIRQPIEVGVGEPFISSEVILQKKDILNVVTDIGHISDTGDPDGVFRHSLMIIKVDTGYLPSLPLAIFMNIAGVKLNDISIEWGESITIPADKSDWLNNDLVIPIDEHGRIFIPYVDNWGRDFDHLSVSGFNSYTKNGTNPNQLVDFFEGRVVLIGDVSTGIADMANTTLDENVPLIALQASVLNALMMNKFYKQFPISLIVLIITCFCILFTFLASLKNPVPFIFTSISSIIILIGVCILSLINFKLLPIVSLTGSTIFYFTSLSVALQLLLSKEGKLIEQENIRRSHEMEEARKIQFSMLPKSIPDVPNIQISTFMKTATEVGGDYYDFHYSIATGLTIAVGDATGHGLKAGTMVTITKSLFNLLAIDSNLLSILHSMNKCIKQLNLHLLYMCLVIIKIHERRISIVSAGMPPVLIYKKKLDIIEEIIIKAMPLGSFIDFPYQEKSCDLETGDVVVVMSDGLIELFNANKEEFEMQRVKNILKAEADKDPETISQIFQRAISDWTNDISDDITIIIFKIQ